MLSLTGRLILWSNSNNSNTSSPANSSFISSPAVSSQWSWRIRTEKLGKCQSVESLVMEVVVWCVARQLNLVASLINIITLHPSTSLLSPHSSPDMRSSVGVWPNKMTMPGIWCPEPPATSPPGPHLTSPPIIFSNRSCDSSLS